MGIHPALEPDATRVESPEVSPFGRCAMDDPRRPPRRERPGRRVGERRVGWGFTRRLSPTRRESNPPRYRPLGDAPWTIRAVRRAENARADELVNDALDGDSPG